MLSDNSYSSFEPNQAESVSRTFTEITLLHKTAVHALYRAKRFGRWYLLKTLLPQYSTDPVYSQMLQKEMEILMQLQHPGIVGCLGLEYVDKSVGGEGGKPLGECIIMEYIDGITLKEWLAIKDDTHAREKEAERIMSEVLSAMTYAHAAGITHRDLKPSNVMLTRNGQSVRIIDFSLSDADNYAILKQPSGTQQYMSPEQATATLPDVRNDIYSLGIIMQQMPLPRYWRTVVRRCLVPIGQRYAHISELQDDIARRHKRSLHLRVGAIVSVVAILLSLPGILGWYRSERQRQALLDEQNRVPHAVSQALSQMEERIIATGLTAHMDTLTHWRWLDSLFNEKVLSVNSFAYDYTAQPFEGFSGEEMDRVLVAMLDRWQAWHDSIVGKAKLLMEAVYREQATE